MVSSIQWSGWPPVSLAVVVKGEIDITQVPESEIRHNRSLIRTDAVVAPSKDNAMDGNTRKSTTTAARL